MITFKKIQIFIPWAACMNGINLLFRAMENNRTILFMQEWPTAKGTGKILQDCLGSDPMLFYVCNSALKSAEALSPVIFFNMVTKLMTFSSFLHHKHHTGTKPKT